MSVSFKTDQEPHRYACSERLEYTLIDVFGNEIDRAIGKDELSVSFVVAAEVFRVLAVVGALECVTENAPKDSSLLGIKPHQVP